MWLKTHQTGKIALVLGSTGNKGESRRKDFGLLLNQHPEIQVFLTADDPNYEDPMAIADEISSYINHPVEKLRIAKKLSRQPWLSQIKTLDAVIIAGKGADCYQIVQGKKEAIQEMQPSQKIIYKIVKKSREMNPLIFLFFI